MRMLKSLLAAAAVLAVSASAAVSQTPVKIRLSWVAPVHQLGLDLAREEGPRETPRQVLHASSRCAMPARHR